MYREKQFEACMKKMNVLPFYMTYPTVAYTKENGMVEDLEYFQQMY